MKKILFINQEITPFVTENPVSVLGRKVPETIQDRGHDIRTFTPKWDTINERRNQLHEVIRLSGMNLIIDDTDHTLMIKVAAIPGTRVQVYFIDNNEYFAKRNVDENGVEDANNDERAVFFARSVLETVKKLRWIPDIIHCQGWISAIIPFYLKTAYKDEPCYKDVKIVTSLFADDPNLEFGARFKTLLEYEDAKKELLDKYSKFDSTELAMAAIEYSDAVIEATESVSPDLVKYAESSGKKLLKFADIKDIGDAYEAFFEAL